MLELEPLFEHASATTTEPIGAWRAWTLWLRGGHALLRPIAGSHRPWTPLEAARASCKRPRFHPAPAFDCTCGLYGTRGPDLLRRARDPAVIGTVALWGRVIEHEHGYRAALAYPQRLRVVCHLCFWQWGVGRSTPDVVARLPRGRMVPLCAEHVETSRRYGFPVTDLIPSSIVQQDLLSTYAVDLLA